MSKTFDDPDLPATAEELARAEVLAQTLDGACTSPSPELEAAALLRQARGAPVPDVLDQVLPTPNARRRRWWLFPAMLVPAVAGLLVTVTGLFSYRSAEHGVSAESCVPPSAPPPSAKLLAAQSRAASGNRAALVALEAEMRIYRATMHREGKKR